MPPIALKLALLCWLFPAGAASAGLAERHGAEEYAIKAAFVFNFAKFVEWPSLTETGASMTLCVLGADPFGATLDALQGKTVQGRPLAIKRLRTLKAEEGCHMLFIARSEQENLGHLLAALRDQPVLTIADMAGFAKAGGIINLVMVEDKVRFEINQGAAQRAGLRISSKLLSLGKIVDGGTEED